MITKSIDHIQIYPNPAKEILKISGVLEGSIYKIYSMPGQ